MDSKIKNSDKKSNKSTEKLTAFRKTFIANSTWDDQDEFLDVIYWMKQILGVIFGLIWGIIPLKGFLGLALYAALTASITYIYFAKFQRVDEEEFGGLWELMREGFMTAFAGFLVTWIITYTSLYHTLDSEVS